MIGEPPMGPMGDEEVPPMEDMNQEPPMEGNESTDNEVMDVISQLSVEDQAAVKKYAKSLLGDKGQEDNQQMPMESHKYNGSVIGERLSDKNHKRPSERGETKVPKEYSRKRNNPWIAPNMK